MRTLNCTSCPIFLQKWADVLCSLLDSLIAASASVTAFAKKWDTDFPNEPDDVTLDAALQGISDVAVPEAACPLMTTLRQQPGAMLTAPSAVDRTVINADVHPGEFLNPYFRKVDLSTRCVTLPTPAPYTHSTHSRYKCSVRHRPPPRMHGVRVLPFDHNLVTENASLSGGAGHVAARAVVVPVVQRSWDHPEDISSDQGVWRYAIVHVNLDAKRVTYIGAHQHDQGCVRAIKVSGGALPKLAHVRKFPLLFLPA